MRNVIYYSLIFVFSLTGCVTEYNLATQQEETLLYDTEKEIRIGEKVAPQIEKQFGVVTDVDVNERVERILDKIVAVCDRKDLVYFIKVLDDEPLNAVSLPGGYVFIFKGLIDEVDNDDQLAGVIAHEVAHITAKHGIKRMQNAYGALLLQIASTQAGGSVAQGTQLALLSLFMEHSQEAEFESDRIGVKYMKKAGYDPKEMTVFLGKLKDEEEKRPLRTHSYWRTHPFLSRRIAVVNQAITGKLEFKDYMNMIGHD